MKNKTIEALRRFLEPYGPGHAWLIQTGEGWEMGVRVGGLERTLVLPEAVLGRVELLEHAVAGFLADLQRERLRAALGVLDEISVELDALPAFDASVTQAQRIDPEFARQWRLLQDDEDVYQRSTSMVDTVELARRLATQRETMASPTMQLHATPETKLAEIVPHLVRRGGRAYRVGDEVTFELPGPMGSTHRIAYTLEDFLRLPVPELLARALERTGALPRRS